MTFRDLDTISYKAELVWYCSVMPACPGHLQQDHGQAARQAVRRLTLPLASAVSLSSKFYQDLRLVSLCVPHPST